MQVRTNLLICVPLSAYKNENSIRLLMNEAISLSMFHLSSHLLHDCGGQHQNSWLHNLFMCPQRYTVNKSFSPHTCQPFLPLLFLSASLSWLLFPSCNFFVSSIFFPLSISPIGAPGYVADLYQTRVLGINRKCYFSLRHITRLLSSCYYLSWFQWHLPKASQKVELFLAGLFCLGSWYITWVWPLNSNRYNRGYGTCFQDNHSYIQRGLIRTERNKVTNRNCLKWKLPE